MSEKNYYATMERADNKCEFCGKTINLEIHHEEQYAGRQVEKFWNYIVLCIDCHRGNNGRHGCNQNIKKFCKDLIIKRKKDYEQ